MPFTFSHPAIVLPLTYLPKRWFSLTGLVIGSMVPDVEYFIRMRVQSDFSHTPGGLLGFDLPVGICLAWIFHNLIRNTLYDNLPAPLASRLQSFKQFDWHHYFTNNVFVVMVSVLTGAISHLLWDGFTHEGGYAVNSILALRNTISVNGTAFPLYKMLQHASTLAGGLVILIYLFKLPPHAYHVPKTFKRYWATIALLTIVITVTRILIVQDYSEYGNLIVTFISAFLFSLSVTPRILRNAKKTHHGG